jgi:hypothetical protein
MPLRVICRWSSYWSVPSGGSRRRAAPIWRIAMPGIVTCRAPIRHETHALGHTWGMVHRVNHGHGRSLPDTPDLPFAWGNARCQSLPLSRFFPDTEEDGGSTPPAPTTPRLNRASAESFVQPRDGTHQREVADGRESVSLFNQSVHSPQLPAGAPTSPGRSRSTLPGPASVSPTNACETSGSSF